MAIQLKQNAAYADASQLSGATHILFVLPAKRPKELPYLPVLEARMKRQRSEYAELAKSPLTADLPDGARASWVVLDEKQSVFQRHTLLRKAVKPLLEESPAQLVIALYLPADQAAQAAADAIYVSEVNAVALPTQKSKPKSKQPLLKALHLYGYKQADGFAAVRARAQGNILVRQLTVLPPNALTPAIYRDRIAELAKTHGWEHESYDMKKLAKMGAGAFVAVGQGSDPQDAAIVHLRYKPKHAKKRISLVGKGICFDTGGHNLKPARYMNGMHEDMNGSAVVLGTLLAATEAGLPVEIDAWLAIAQNHIGPRAYKQNDVITALNGTTIEIVHTDAEGRMVLADTLTLASRQKPDFMMDFATLTGSMMTAVGNRYSGIIGNRPEMLCQAVVAGAEAGERVCVFPFDADYEEELDSDIADIKQCTLDSDADHIIAARFLSRFIEGDIPWMHVDLAAVNRKGGLGAVASDTTGFGVGFTLNVIRAFVADKA
jgi:leucyl aminopeptidase